MRLANLKHVGNNSAVWDETFPDFQHTTLEYDAIMTITDAGVQILE